jgi:hypothetical protein
MLRREGAERTEPLAPRFRVMNAPSVGRFHGHLRTSVVPTRADSAPPGLATFIGRPALTNRDNPQRAWFPGIPFGWASFRTQPSPRVPPMARSVLNRRLPFGFNHQSDALDL